MKLFSSYFLRRSLFCWNKIGMRNWKKKNWKVTNYLFFFRILKGFNFSKVSFDFSFVNLLKNKKLLKSQNFQKKIFQLQFIFSLFFPNNKKHLKYFCFEMKWKEICEESSKKKKKIWKKNKKKKKNKRKKKKKINKKKKIKNIKKIKKKIRNLLFFQNPFSKTNNKAKIHPQFKHNQFKIIRKNWKTRTFEKKKKKKKSIKKNPVKKKMDQIQFKSMRRDLLLFNFFNDNKKYLSILTIEEWDSRDICQFLTINGFNGKAAKFIEEKIDGRTFYTLLSCSKDCLKILKVKKQTSIINYF